MAAELTNSTTGGDIDGTTGGDIDGTTGGGIDGTTGGDMGDPSAWRAYLSTLCTGAAVEMAQLRRRCKGSFQVLRREPSGLVAVKFTLRATDPDLTFPLANKEMQMVAEVSSRGV